MKHPFWIANSALFFLILLALVFIYFSHVPLPEREDIEIAVTPPPAKREVLAAININKIYEQDLFDTYQEPQAKEKKLSIPLPEPPKPQVISIPKIPTPQFVDPMDVTLKGVIFLSSIEGKNRAIIEDNTTKKEDVYKVGDKIEDAQLIRIFGNKVIFLRSNGQQEVLYLREQDAKLDPVYANIDGWRHVIQQITPDRYEINQQELLHRIKNLGQFIDMLGITTAYKQGKSIGVRVGKLESNSLGTALGLNSGDIISTIKDMPTATTENRIKIYKYIINMEENDEISINIVRNSQELTLNYIVANFNNEQIATTQAAQQDIKSQHAENKKRKIMQQKHKFAPTLQQIRHHEKQLMFKKGRAPQKNNNKVKAEQKS